MTIPKELTKVVASDPQILGGTLCFIGTRVPLATFLDHIELGYSLDRFLQGYSSVKRDQATTVLEWLSHHSRELIGLDLAS